MMIFFLYKYFPSQVYPMSGLGGFIIKPYGAAAELVLLIAAVLIGRKFSPTENLCRKLQKYWLAIVILLAAAYITGVIIATLFFADTKLTAVQNYVVFSDKFGSGRGYIWRRIPHVYGNLPFINKIFGCGPSCFGKAVYPYYGKEMLSLFGGIFYGAHNEFLEILMEFGIAGVVGYFGMILGMMHRALKNREKNPVNIVVIVTLCSYLAQGLVNEITIFTLPLLFIFLGCANRNSSFS